MANYATLKAAVENAVKTNGTGAITGATLQATLLGTIESLTAGYQFMGVATPLTEPGTPDQRVFYIGGAGAYSNFGATYVPKGCLGIFSYNSSWTYNVINVADYTLVNVNDLINQSTPFASASAARSAIPQQYQKPGLNITYLLRTSENTSQWVQDIFIGDNVIDWSVADNWKVIGPVSVSQNSETGKTQLEIGGDVKLIVDKEPEAGSTNLVESGGVDVSIHTVEQDVNNIMQLVPTQKLTGQYIKNDGTFGSMDLFDCYKYEIKPNSIYFYSGRYDSIVRLSFVVITDEDGNVLAQIGYSDYVDVLRKDEPFYTTYNGAKFAYLNVYVPYASSFCLAEYNSVCDYRLANMIGLKSYNLSLIDSIIHNYFRPSSHGYYPNIQMVCFKFEVLPEHKYKVSCKLSAGMTGNKVYYVSQDDYTNLGGDCPGDADEEITYTDFVITTPQYCKYIYFNVDLTYVDYARLEILDIPAAISTLQEDSLFKPITTNIAVSSSTANAYWSPTTDGTKSNTLLNILKYAVTAGTTYLVRGKGKMTAADAYQCVWIDGDGHTISAFGKRLDDDAHDYLGTAPADAVYLYVNTYTSYNNDTTVKAVDTDRTAEIQGLLSKNGLCKLGEGVFFVDSLAMPEYAKLDGCGNSTIVVLTGESDGYAVRLSRYNTISNIRFMGAVQDISVGEPSDYNTINIGNRHGVLLLGNAQSGTISFDENFAGNSIVNCSFRNFSGGAITCEQTGFSMKNGLLVSDCHIYNCGAGFNLSYFAEFNRFTGNQVHHCTYGVINNGGNNNYVNCDFSECAIGFYANGGTDKCLKYNGTTATGVNMMHGIMDGCTINHMGLGINANNGYSIMLLNAGLAGYIFTSIQNHYGRMRIIGSSKIQMVNVRLGGNSHIDTVSNLLVLFCNFLFGGTSSLPTISVYTDASMTTIDRNYLTDGNLQSVKILNSFDAAGNAVSISTFAPN